MMPQTASLVCYRFQPFIGLQPHHDFFGPSARLRSIAVLIIAIIIVCLPATALIGTGFLVISTIQTPSSTLDGPTR